MRVQDLYKASTLSIPLNAPLRDVVTAFFRNRIDTLPVVDAAQHVVGMVRPTDLIDYLFPRFHDVLRDYAALEDKGQLSILIEAAFSSLDLADEKLVLAADLMRSNLAWVSYEEPLLSAASRLFSQNMPQLPVVDRDRRLMGLLSQNDIVLALLQGQHSAPAR